jgi:hypothetical protein
MLAIRRLALEVGQAVTVDVVRVAIPELILTPERRHFARLAPRVYALDSLDGHSGGQFAVDELGVAEDHPGGWRRLAVPPAHIARPLGPR